MDKKFQQHGALSWGELMTTDTQAAKAFYGALFGWAFNDYDMAAKGCEIEGPYTCVKVGNEEVMGLMAMPKDVPPGMPPCWGLYITVDDVEATVAQARELGAVVLVEPRDIPGTGRFAVIRDPQGAVLNVITYAFDKDCCQGCSAD